MLLGHITAYNKIDSRLYVIKKWKFEWFCPSYK